MPMHRLPLRVWLPVGAAALGATFASGIVVPQHVQALGQTAIADRSGNGPAHGDPGRSGQPAQRRAIDTQLQNELVQRMSHATARTYGLVVDVAGIGRVASIRPTASLRPASTQKLFTTLPVLLDQPGRRLLTVVAVGAKPAAGVVHGDLVVRAALDPSLLRRHLIGLAEQVRAAGVRTVTGHLTLVIGSLPTRTRQPGWKADFVPWDVGPLSPFPVYEDVWRHDRAYLADPTRANLALFRTKLASAGVHIKGSSRIVRTATADIVVATHRSEPLRQLVRTTLRISDNFYAESLLVLAGGHRRVNQVATAAGVTDASSATDGSGLSYDDRETARGEVTLLEYAHASPARADLLAALPVACRSGTLKHRFCKTIAAGKVFAKTGTLTHTTALAGFTTDGLGRLVTFSVICAGVHSVDKAMHATDRVVLALRHYTG